MQPLIVCSLKKRANLFNLEILQNAQNSKSIS